MKRQKFREIKRPNRHGNFSQKRSQIKGNAPIFPQKRALEQLQRNLPMTVFEYSVFEYFENGKNEDSNNNDRKESPREIDSRRITSLSVANFS